MYSRKQLESWYRAGKEHPGCRRAIIEGGIVPYPSVEEWDGRSVNAEGKEMVRPRAKSMHTQMARMIVEGYPFEKPKVKLSN